MSSRNYEIWKKWMSGRTYKSLALEYELSPQRIRDIAMTENQRHGVVTTLRGRFIQEFADLTEELSQASMSVHGMFNGLMRAAPEEAFESPSTFMEWFLERNADDFMEFRGFGPAKTDVLLKIQERIKGTDGLKEKLLDGCIKIGARR